MNEYTQQAKQFLADTGTVFNIHYQGTYKYFDGDKDERDVYSVTLRNERGEYTFNFGDSIYNTESRLANWKPQQRMSIHDYELAKRKRKKEHSKPSSYDVLACLQAYPVGDFDDFCGDFGYSTDSINAEETWRKVRTEYANLKRIFTSEELEQLAEIN